MKKINVTIRRAIVCASLSFLSVCLFVSTARSQGGTCGFATAQQSPINSGICIACSVQDSARAKDADTTNYSTVTALVSGLGYFGQLLKFGSTYLAGDSVTVVLEIPNTLVTAQLLGGIGVTTYTGGSPTGTTVLANDPLVRLQLLGGGTNKFRLTFAATSSFDGVAITINGLVSLLTTVRIYSARAFVAPPRIVLPVGTQATSQTSPVITGVCVLCSVSNPALAVDRDTTTYSSVTSAVGALGYIGQLLKFPGSFRQGDSIRLLMQLPVSVTDVQVLGGLRVETYLNNVAGGHPILISNGLARVELLNNGNKIRVTFAAQDNFDAVLVSINGTVTALTTLRIFDAAVVSSAQSIINICTGSSAVLNAGTPTGATFNWYTTATGGSSIATGSNFTTAPLSTATTYYVEASRNGCANPARTAVTVNPVAIPSAPVITPSSLNICPGDSVKATVANPNGYLTTWYTAPTGGTLVTTGDTLAIGNLTVTTTYYAQSSNSGCAAPSRTALPVTVGAIPANITVTPASATINSGQTASFTAASGDAVTTGYVYSWYAQPSGGTPVYTGASFTTPALMSSTTYYLQVRSAIGCTNPARIAVPVTVTNSTPGGGGGNNVPCDAASIQNNSVNGLCIGCSVTTPAAAADNDTTTYSTLHIVAGLLGAYVEQDLFFPFQGDAGDTIRVGVHFPSSVADVSVLSSLQLASYLGTTYNNDRANTGSALIKLNLLPGNQDAILSFVPQASYDRLEIRLNSGAATLISQTGIRYAARTKPAATITPAAPAACAGSVVALSATANANTVFTWYDAATGGTVLATGASYTTHALTSTTTYYVATESLTGCQGAVRTPVTITIQATPAAPVPAATQLNACAGTTVSASIPSPDASLTYRWYTVPTGGTAVATGISFTSGVLSSDTVFYVEAANSTGCAGSRTAINVSTSPQPTAPDAISTSAAVCAGTAATLVVRNPSGAYTYQWFTVASGGTPAGTGISFTTPTVMTNTTYYVTALTAQGCNSVRTPVAVIVNPAPASPAVTISPLTPISSGQTAVITVNSPTLGETYNYYLQASGGVPAGTGNSYTTPGLQATTTYYVEAVSAGGCSSITRTTANVIVNATVSLDCDAPTSQVNSANLACVACLVNNPGFAVDADTATSSTLNLAIGIPTAAMSQTLIFPSASEAGDSLSILIALPGTLSPADLGSALQLETLNGGVSNADIISASDASVRVMARAGNQYLLRFAPSATYDRVRLILNSGLVTLFNSLDIYYATRKVSAPVAPALPVTVCSGATANLSVTTGANVTVNWYTVPTGGSIVSSGNTIAVPSVTNNTVYYAEAVRTSNGCINTARVPVMILVNPSPAAPSVVSGNITVCPGNSAALFISNTLPQLTYNWYAAATGGSILATGASFNTPAVSTNTVYYAGAANSSGCGSSTRTPVNIAVASSPDVPVITGNTAVCTGGTALLTVSNAQSGVTYNFYNTATGGSILASGTSFTTPALAAGRSYFVEAVGSQSCSAGTARTEVAITVNNAPDAPVLTAENLMICNGSIATVSILSPQTGVTYRWYDVPTAGTALFSGVSATTGALTANTTLYAEASSGTGCVSASRNPVTIWVVPAPTAPVITQGNNVTSCDGGAATLTIQSPVTGIAYDWYNAATGGVLLTTAETFTTPQLQNNASFYVEARNSNGCTSPRTAVAVTVAPFTATVSVLPVNPVVAPGSGTTLTVSNPQTGYTYRFYNASGVLLTTGTSYNTGALSATTLFYVEAVSPAGCVSPLRTAVTVTVTGAPGDPVVGLIPPICAGSTANISVTNPESGAIYNWYDQATGGTLLFTAPSITTPVLLQTTNYYVSATRNGTTSGRTAAIVNVNPVPSAPAVSPVSVSTCSTAPVSVSVQGALSSTTYNWYTTPVGGTPFSSGTTLNIPIPTTSVYYVDAVNALGCASLTRTPVSVTLLPALAAPVAQFVSKTDTTLTFGWDPVPGAIGYEYSIDGGVTWIVSNTGTEKLQQVIGNLQPGVVISFSVRSIGTTACQSSVASNSISAETDNHLGDEVFVPNSFTPNGDGRNDRFRPYGNTLQTMEMSIYTQWGNLIYHQANDINGWDGTAGGKAQPTGVYIYVIRATLRNNNVVIKKGSVNLIR